MKKAILLFGLLIAAGCLHDRRDAFTLPGVQRAEHATHEPLRGDLNSRFQRFEDRLALLHELVKLRLEEGEEYREKGGVPDISGRWLSPEYKYYWGPYRMRYSLNKDGTGKLENLIEHPKVRPFEFRYEIIGVAKVENEGILRIHYPNRHTSPAYAQFHELNLHVHSNVYFKLVGDELHLSIETPHGEFAVYKRERD